jgi:phosphatidylserine/phosphatidylglycerophosphate/cardiolipin synthase-like enzyme
MSDLLKLSTPDLLELAAALRGRRLVAPFTPLAVQRFVPTDVAVSIANELQSLHAAGTGPEQIAVAIEFVGRDRQTRGTLEQVIDLVTTGPEAQGVANRDTAVVVRELFANATESVLVAGYAVYQGQRVFQTLADRMESCSSLKVRTFLDVQRGPGDSSAATEIVRRFAERFRQQQWPPNRPLPEVWYDPRSLDLGGDKKSSLHAKCVVVDRQHVFISSANFTEAAQERNIEVGLLVHSRHLAEQLTYFFDAMIAEGGLQSVF